MTIHATAIVEEGAQLSENVSIGPYCHVGKNVTLEQGVVLMNHVVVSGHTRIGARTCVYPFAVLGGSPQHFGYKGEETTLEIGTDNVIREHVTMHLGTVAGGGKTCIGSHGLFMASSHVAHDVIMGDHTIMVNNSALAGHVVVGDHVYLGGLVGVHQFCRLGSYSFIGASSFVTADVIPYGSVIGNHAALQGLNITGMKRQNMPRSVIHDLRAVYRLLFAEEGTLQERIADVSKLFSTHKEVSQILQFIKEESARPICTPRG